MLNAVVFDVILIRIALIYDIYHVGLANQMLAKFQHRCNGLMAEAHVFSIQLDMLQYCSNFMQHVYTSFNTFNTTI